MAAQWQPDQQLTRAGPPAARLDRTDVPLDGADDVELMTLT
ncbi:MAG TPA: hypothetical protein VF391_13070 [Dermatophilaceae bacterium]